MTDTIYLPKDFEYLSSEYESYLEMRKSTGLFNQVMEMLNEPFEVLHLDSVPV